MSEPKLRFKADDGSEFPEWEEKKLIDMLSQPITDGPHETPQLVNMGVPFISVDSIVDNKINFDKKRGYISNEYNEQCNKKYKPRKNDIYLVKSGATVGKVAFVEDDRVFNIWSPLAAMRVNENNNYLFLYYLLQTEFIQHDIQVKSFGGTQPNLSMRILEKFSINRPCHREQLKISELFSKLDNVIEQTQSEIDAWEKQKRGVMQLLFSRKVRFQADDGSEFPEWEEKSLKEICDIVSGGTPSTDHPEYWNGDIQWFTPTEVGHSKYVKYSKRTITKAGLSKSNAKLLPVGTILLTTRATLGEMSIAATECCTNQGFQSLVVKPEFSRDYVYYLQDVIKPYCKKHAAGSTFLEISSKQLGKCNVPVPCIEEQQRIAACLSGFDDVIDKAKKELEAYRELKMGLLQQMFV